MKKEDIPVGMITRSQLIGILASIHYLQPELYKGLNAVALAAELFIQFPEPPEISVEAPVRRLGQGRKGEGE